MSGRISEVAKNALSELGNIGAGNATTSLSILLSSKITVTPPKVALYDFNELENVLGGPETTVVGVLSGIEGELKAMILFVMNIDDAKQLAAILLNDDNIEWHSSMGISAIKEIANIIIGSYIASLETLSGLKIRYSVPDICIDMAASILSVPCIEFGSVGDKALLINSNFKAGEKNIDGYIMMISETHSYDVLLNQLGIGGIDG